MAAPQPGFKQPIPAPRTSCTGGGAPNNLPPLSFHSVHSERVVITGDGATAWRFNVESFGKELAFSARPVRVNEKVCIRFVLIITNTKYARRLRSTSAARFGFTNHDPATLADSLTKFGCSDLTNNKQPGIWAKDLDKRFCEKDKVFYYYVNSAGEVHFGVNGEEKGLFFSGVDIRSPLWALVDLDGSVKAVQFADTHNPDEERLASSMRSLSVEEPLYQNTLVPLSLHRTNGKNVNLPPLGFHIVRSENMRISRDGATARRVPSSSKGVTFSARPVSVNEKVCIRFVEILKIRCSVRGAHFGFTNHDPATLAYPHSLPKYACPDLTNTKQPGNWAKALEERFSEKDNVFYYYVNSVGEVYFGVNGEEKGLFFSGVDIRSPLWALVILYGNAAIQFADTHNPDEERLASSMQSLSVEEPVPAPRGWYLVSRYQNLVPLNLHRTKGRNVQFWNDRGIAARCETEICQGYVFTALPMRPGQTIFVQLLATEVAYSGSLAIGLTSCDPATLRPCDLPDDAELLHDRPEYWVVRRDAAKGLRGGDELAVTLSMDGELRVSRNGSNPITDMHVDHTLKLWAFVDIYGSTQKVRMLSSHDDQMRVITSSATPIATASGGTGLVVSLTPQNNQNAVNHQQMTLASAHDIEPIQSSQLCLSSLPLTQPSCSLPQPGPRPPLPRGKAPRDQCSASQNSINEQVQKPNDLRPTTSRQIRHSRFTP